MVEIIDCRYLKRDFAAAFLIVDGERAAFVENNTAHAVPLLLEALDRTGLKREQVEYAIITHVHLDHASGSSALLDACPNATLLAHPRAATHMIDPSKLVASARKVYGDAAFEKLYGTLEPIPAHRVRAMNDGDSVSLGNRRLKFIYTRGHANHHFCIHDSGSNGVFTGDSFGLAYPELQKNGLFIFPSTSPTDFDPQEALATLGKILATGADKAYLTHYGEIRDLPAAAAQLEEHLRFAQGLLEEGIRSPRKDEELQPWMEKELRGFFAEQIRRREIPFTDADWETIRLDLELNAAGIAHVAKKRRAEALKGK